MGQKVFVVFLSGLLAACFAGVALAQHSHSHGAPSTATSGMGSQEMSMNSQPAQSLTVEGYKITFEVMDMSAHMAMPGMKGMRMPGMKGNPEQGGSEQSKSHVIMVTVQDTISKEIISDARVAYAVLSPGGKKEAGKLEWSGDYYGGGFNPTEKGQYQVQVTVEGGGIEREAKFTYDAK